MSMNGWRETLVAFTLGLVCVTTASAQEPASGGQGGSGDDTRLPEGMWTGTVYPPDGDLIELEYEVSYGEGGLSLVLHPPADTGVGPVTADDPVYEALTLTFTLIVGETIMCTLFGEEDGHLEGDCIGPDGEPAVMTMFPPAG